MNQKRKKILIKAGIGIVFISLLIFFGRPILSSILFKVEGYRIVWNYNRKKAEIEKIAEFTKDLPPIEFTLSDKNRIRISFSDSISRFNPMTFHFNNIVIEDRDTFEILLSYNHELTVILPDTIFSHDFWTCYYHGRIDNSNLETLLDYYGWTVELLSNLAEKIRKANCYGFEKDCFGDITLMYSIVDLYPNVLYNPPRYRAFNYIITNDFERFKNENVRKIENNIYWWDNMFLFCLPEDEELMRNKL